MLEIAGLILACVSGIALPMLAARNARLKALEDRVAAQDVKIAQIESLDLRGLRADVSRMNDTLQRLVGALEAKRDI